MKKLARSRKDHNYHVVRRDDLGRVVISEEKPVRAREGRFSTDLIISEDAVRFSGIRLGHMKSGPGRQKEQQLRKAVRETMKQKPLAKF